MTEYVPLTWNTTKSYYTHTYTYDTMSRLTVDDVKDHNNVQVEEWSYSYDKASNRLSFSQFSTGTTISYSYLSANELNTTVVDSLERIRFFMILLIQVLFKRERKLLLREFLLQRRRLWKTFFYKCRVFGKLTCCN